jgi:hypothetical protein
MDVLSGAPSSACTLARDIPGSKPSDNSRILGLGGSGLGWGLAGDALGATHPMLNRHVAAMEEIISDFVAARGRFMARVRCLAKKSGSTSIFLFFLDLHQSLSAPIADHAHTLLAYQVAVICFASSTSSSTHAAI